MIMQVSGVITGNVIALPPHFSVPVAVNTCRLKFQTPVPRLARRVDTAERYCNFFLAQRQYFATYLMQIKRQEVCLQPGAGCKPDAPMSVLSVKH